MNVYLVILEDRHIDPDISVFTTREAADRCFDAHKDDYPGEQWVSDEPCTEHWLRFEHTDDDGPNLRIEWHELRDSKVLGLAKNCKRLAQESDWCVGCDRHPSSGHSESCLVEEILKEDADE